MNWKQLKKKLSGDKGYYLALAVCAAAVVVSGWLFVRSLRTTDDELTLPDAVQAAVLPTPAALDNDRMDAVGEDRMDARSPVEPGKPGRTTVPADAETEAPQQVNAPGNADAESPSEAPAVQVPDDGALTAACRPVDGAVVQGYSMDRLAYNATTRDWRTHAGMDIAAPEGSEVRAAAEGTVLAVFTDDLLGRTVTVEHPGGWVTHYANLAEEVAVSAGDRVEAGQVLGTVGRTAMAEVGGEPHLHFAVYRNNVPQDPGAFLAG